MKILAGWPVMGSLPVAATIGFGNGESSAIP
jgi:hypothetical protein